MSKTILTIDDQGDVRRLIRMTLEFQGHKVLEAMNAESGIEAARRNKPNMILLDLNMPGVNGMELIKFFAADPDLSATPIVMLTGTDDEATRQRALASGAKMYLTKPFNPMGLLELVEQHAG